MPFVGIFYAFHKAKHYALVKGKGDWETGRNFLQKEAGELVNIGFMLSSEETFCLGGS